MPPGQASSIQSSYSLEQTWTFLPLMVTQSPEPICRRLTMVLTKVPLYERVRG